MSTPGVPPYGRPRISYNNQKTDPSESGSQIKSSYFRNNDPNYDPSSAPSFATLPRHRQLPRSRSQTQRDINSQSASASKHSSRGQTSLNYSSPGPVRTATPAPSTVSGRKSRATGLASSGDSQHIICALSEARGITPSVGIAFINISTGEAILSQISDNQFYVKTVHKVQMLDPSRVLIVSTSCPPNPKSNLYGIIEEHVSNASILPYDRRYWSETAGLDFVRDLAFREDADAIKVAIEGNFYATCAFAAAMRYLETECRLQIVSHSLRIRYQPSEDTMMIDMSAIQSLELIQNLRNSKSKDCLYGLLNHTVTPMGARMLRSNILQPSTVTDRYLTPRYDAIEELTTQEVMFNEIRKSLKAFSDVESLLSKLVILPSKGSIQEFEHSINQVLMVKDFLDAIPVLFHSLASANAPLLTKIRDLCRPDIVHSIRELISRTIHEDVTYIKTPLDLRNQRTFAVQAGVSGLLDVARQTYKEGTEEVHKHVEKLNREFNLDASVKYDNARKYWLRLRASDFEDREVPDPLISKFKKGRFIECQTLDLRKLNQRISDSANEVAMMSDKVVQELLDGIRTQVQPMFRVCESVALLDMISSFSQLAILRDYVRPEITGTLALKSARHPVMDKTLGERFVPNDFYATDEYRFQTITGCNMSGKSTYIRSVALLQIMAQIGCFVPASYAAFPIIHDIFARVSTDDSIEANMSTFSMEMREMAFILRNVNDRSMVIIDELGRGTSTRDGLAIAIAIAEALVQSKAKVWFATHFTELALVLAGRPGVLNLYLATETSTTTENLPQMTMLYKVTSGTVEQDHYGITLAKAMGFPDRFIRIAEEVATSLRQQREDKEQSSEATKLQTRRKLILTLHETLKQASDSNMDDRALGFYLTQLRDEFITRMETIEGGVISDGVGEDRGRLGSVEESDNGDHINVPEALG